MPLWRWQSDDVHSALLRRWLPPVGEVLKTDLFDELVSPGLLPALRERASRVTGVDTAETVLREVAARERDVECVRADVRALPLDDGRFDAVVSTSTLDHLGDRGEVLAALCELARVTRPGGVLVITMDNPLNPLVATRNRLPRRVAAAVRKVDFDTGWTCGPRTLRRLLAEAGFDPEEMTAVLHCPRLAVAAMGSGGSDPLRRAVAGWERLERLPTRWLTGHYVAARARRR